jgi:pimeloyl-ACP methyl ester carboxylesterase
MRHVPTFVAGTALVALAALSPAQAAEPAPTAVPDRTIGPLQAGTSAYVDGTYTWTDYAYDDTGANTSVGEPGAATYPDASDQSNAADLVQLQARLAPTGGLDLTAVLETLTKADEPLVGIGLDTDRNTATGAAALPGWTPSGRLGLDVLITASADGGALSTWSGGAWKRTRSLPAKVDPGDNTVRTTIPADVVGTVTELRAVAAVGLRRASASWLSGTGPIYDLAFVRGDEPTAGSSALVSASTGSVTGEGHATGGEWLDRHQADVLAGHLPASGGLGTIDLGALRSGRTSIPSPLTEGYHSMLYHSGVALPEGIVDGTAAGGLWAGPYQPFLVQVPPHATRGLPVLMYLHGGGANHNSNGLFAPQGELQLGRAIGVFPYGREPTTASDHGYQGVNEKDVLDALSYAQEVFSTDVTRTVVLGESTGGAGALRLAMLHPDRFSGVLAFSAYDDTHVMQNLINTPLVMHNGMADPAASQGTLALTLSELDGFGDVGYRSYSVLAHSHADPAAPVSQCLLPEMLKPAIVANPPRVHLGLDPGNDPATLPPGTDLHHGDAYWLSDVQVRPGTPAAQPSTPFGNVPGYGDSVVASVDVTSLGFARRGIVTHQVDEHGENITSTGTLCGPDETTQSNDVWRIHGLDVKPAAAEPTSNGLRLSLQKVSGLSLDLARMRLSSARPLTITVTGDGPATVRLRGSWHGPVRVLLDSKPAGTVRPSAGVLAVTQDLTGSHTLQLQP